MRRIKPKWLLGGAVLLVAIAVSTVAALATAPTAVNIDSPTNLNPFYRAEGSVVRVDFTYTSNPTNLPQETTGTVEIWTAGGGTRVAYAQKDLANGTDKTDYINVTLPSSLSEGYYDVRVYINNSDGGPATDEESSAVLVDNSDPDPVTDLAVWEDDDSGLHTDTSSDGYLNDTSPTLNWTAPDDNGATPSGIEEYVIKLVGAVVGTVFDWTETSSSATTYTITGPLGQDTYTFYLKARDKAGNESTETTEVFTIDTTPPDAPTMDDEPAYTAGTENTVSWTNPPGASGVRVVRDSDSDPTNGYSIPETWTYQDPDQPPTTFKFLGLSDGSQYWYAAQAQDLAGNWSGWSTVVSSTQDATAPTIGSLAPGDGSWQTTDTPTISAVFTEDGSGINATTIVMKVDGDTVLHTYDAGSKTVSYTPSTALGQGSHTVTVDVSDNVGNAATQASWTFSVDTVAPVFSNGTPVDWTTTKTPDVTVALTEATSGLDAATFTFVVEDSLSNPVSGSGTWDDNVYTWVPDADLTEDETYTVTVNGDDVAGNSAAPYSWSFTVDTIAPVIDTGSPTGWQTANDLTISAAFTETGSGIDTATGTMEIDGTPVGATVTAAGITYDATDLGEGLHTVTVNVSDVAGNPATEYEWTFSVDTVAPVFSNGTPVDWTTTKRPEVTVTVTEETSGLDTFAFVVEDSLSNPVSGSGTWDANVYTWVPDADLTEDETYAVTVNGDDVAGNSATAYPWSFTVDTIAPVIDNGSPIGWQNVNDLTLSAAFTDAGSGINMATGTMEVDGVSVAASATAAGITYDATDLGEGLHTVTVNVSDVAGNPATEYEWTFSVDTVAPVLGSQSPDPWTDELQPDITFTAVEDGSGFDETTFSFSVVDSGGTTVGGSGTWADLTYTWNPDADLAPGETYTVTARISDIAGNTSNLLTWEFTVDAGGSTIDNAKILSDGTDMGDGWETNDPSLTFSVDVEDLGVGLTEPDPKSDITWLITKPVSGTIDEAGGVEGWMWETEGQSGTSTFDPTDANIDQQGVYNITVSAADALGNTATYPVAPATYRFVYDTTAPTLTDATATFNAPMTDLYEDADGNIYTNDDTPTVTFTVADALSGFDVDATGSIAVTGASGVVAGTSVFAGGTAAATITWHPDAAMDDGEYTATLTVDDDAENQAIFIYTFRVDTTAYQVDPESIVAGNQHDDGTWYINTRRPTWHWTNPGDDPCGTVAGSGVKEYDVQVLLDKGDTDTPYGAAVTVPSTGTANEVWQHPDELPLTSGMSVGLSIVTRDNALNESLPVDPGVVFDPDPPSDPSNLEIAGLVSGKTNDRTPTVQWTHSSDDMVGVVQSGVDGYEVDIRKVADPAWGFTTFVDCDPDEDVDETLPDAPFTGSFDWECTTTLGDGQYEVRVRAKDVAGNYSSWVQLATAFEVDATPPAVPSMPATTSPTNDTTPTWTWGAVTGAVSYNVYLDDAVVGNQAGTSYTPAADLSDGQHYLQVSSLDELGNGSALSVAGYVVIDTTDPAAPAMLPLPEHTNANEVIFTWSQVTDAVKYDFSYSLDGGVTWTPVTGLTVQTYTVDISDAEDGDVIKGKAIAYDAAGNDSVESNVVSTTVDRTGPAVTAVWPVATVTTADSTPTWEWDGDDGDGCGVAGYWVTLDEDITVWTTDTWFTPASALEDGDHVVVVVGVDELGNEGDPLEFATVTIDATAPDAPVMAADEPEFTPSTANTVSWGDVSGEARYHVQCSSDSTFTAVDFEDDTVTGTSKEFTGLQDGVTYYYRVRAIDELGNVSFWSNIVRSTQDASGPSAPGTPSTPGPTTNKRPIWTWTPATDAGIGVADYYVELSVGGAILMMVPRQGGGSVVYEGWVGNVTSWTYGADLDDGTYELRVKAKDAFDQEGAWSDAGYVTIDTTAPGVPTNLAVSTPTNDTTPTWTWTASAGDIASYEVSLDGGAAVNIGNKTEYAPGGALSDGVHNLRVRALDALGNKSDWTAEAEVLVDTKAPEIILLSPLEANITTASTVLIELSDGSMGSGVDGESARLRIDEHGEWVAPTAIVGDTLYYVMNLSLLTGSDEDHTLELEIGDVVGNLTKKKWMFKLELYREGFGFGRLRFPETED